MKKPNLTEGEWKFDKDGCCVLDTSDHIIVDTYQPFQTEYICNNNGRACSAVPKLIDALIDLVFLNQCELEGLQSGQPTADQWREAFEKAEKALLKSGVTDL